ncbi:ATP-grasp domain-containing protein [Streptomyces krungchingensis]|uniref:ATP-grasp domain-containing protein n=1 Tax=Streptomyces krungchingensis TaxID=1565034 RepID=UPI003CF23F24
MTPKPSILLLGWRAPYIRIARELGLRTVVLYPPGQLDGGLVDPSEADQSMLVEQLASVEHVLRALARLDISGCVAVHTQEEWALACAGLVAEHLGVRGPDAEVMCRFRDKALQKDHLTAAGFDIPGHLEIPDILNPEVPSRVAEFGFPTVLKPIAGAGTSITVLTRDVADVERAQTEARGHRATPEVLGRRTFIAETFVAGREWHLDGYVQGGELQFLAVSEYGVNPLDTRHGSLLWSRCLDPDREKWAYQLGHDLAERSLKVLGLKEGVFHLEAFHQEGPDRLVFGECGARLGGAMVYEAVLRKFGVDLYRAGVEIAAGLDVTPPGPASEDAVAWTYLTADPGKLTSRPTEDEVLAQPGVTDFRYLVGPDDKVPDTTVWTAARLADAVLVAPTGDELDAQLRELRDWFSSAVVTRQEPPLPASNPQEHIARA